MATIVSPAAAQVAPSTTGSAPTGVTTVRIGTAPTGVATNADTNRVYIADSRANTVSVLDGATNTVSTSFKVGLLPTGVAINSVTNRIYVANSDILIPRPDATFHAADFPRLLVYSAPVHCSVSE